MLIPAEKNIGVSYLPISSIWSFVRFRFTKFVYYHWDKGILLLPIQKDLLCRRLNANLCSFFHRISSPGLGDNEDLVLKHKVHPINLVYSSIKG